MSKDTIIRSHLHGWSELRFMHRRIDMSSFLCPWTPEMTGRPSNPSKRAGINLPPSDPLNAQRDRPVETYMLRSGSAYGMVSSFFCVNIKKGRQSSCCPPLQTKKIT